MSRASAIVFCLSAVAFAAQESFEQQFQRGLLALNRHDFVEARNSLENASRLKPEDARVWVALAQAYLRNKDSNSAAAAANRASQLAPEDPVVNHALAMFYSETGDFGKAAACEQVFANSPSADPLAAARAAEWYLRVGNGEQAIRLAKAAVQKNNTGAVHHLLGQAYEIANRPADAADEFRTAVALDPEREAFVVDLAKLQLRAGDFSGAAATVEQGRKRFSSSAQLELAYGVAAYGLRRFSDAIDAFLRVTRLDPQIEQPYVFLGRIIDQAGDRLPRITAVYAAWEKAEPRSYLPPCLYAKALAAGGAEAPKIEAELRRSIRLKDTYWESHFQLGVMLVQKRDWQSAAQELSRSIELNAENAPAHYQLARVYEKLGQHERAAAERAEHQRLTASESGSEDKRLP